MNTRIADILTQAADYLPGRWHQGYITDRHGSYCALGAIGRQLLTLDEDGMFDWEAVTAEQHQEYMAVVNALAAHLDVRSDYEVAQWNDDPIRTEREVIQALRDAADLVALDERAPTAEAVSA